MRFFAPQLDDPMAHSKEVRRAFARRAEATRREFKEHNDRLRPLLPPPLRLLLGANLHDARIHTLRIDATQQTVHLHLRDCDSNDTQPGTVSDLHLTYADISLNPEQLSLLCLIAHEPTAQIYWDEIDIAEGVEPPVYIHRLVWNSMVKVGQGENRFTTLCPEIELRFRSLEAVPAPASDSSASGAEMTLLGDGGVVTNTIILLQ